MSQQWIGLSRQSGDMDSQPQKHSRQGDGKFPIDAVEQAEILSLLYDISRELTSILDLEQLLSCIGTRVKLLVDYDVFAVMLVNNDMQRLEHAFTLRYDERIEVSRTLSFGEGLCGTAALERKPIRVDRVESDPRYVQCQQDLGVQSELVIPLIMQDRLLGVLDLESLRPSAFTERHEHMLTALASTVAIALENARLYDHLQRVEQRRKDDLDRAREIQQLLLPETMPEVPCLDVAVKYLPAWELGGDFYDFLPYDGGRLVIAVGDVAGKGYAAALLASLGIGLLREHAVHQAYPPAAMLADLNGHLLIPGANGRFITMALAIYDPATSQLSLANAGFPLPLLVRNQEIRPIDVTGLPLGLFPNSSYDETILQLQPGDILVFCSDGVLDQTNAAQEDFGTERLFAQLAKTCESSCAEEVASGIIESVDRYAGEHPSVESLDDRTIVVLRISGS
jgi:sigma-B regulation protein RsbU (phosphoserine phosphatase)